MTIEKLTPKANYDLLNLPSAAAAGVDTHARVFFVMWLFGSSAEQKWQSSIVP
ncbi:MAG: hypothetical protein HYV32_01115 [Candidatus Kerfeldbacteria bacterium]|nr:hypothetical protein [Candidatus Kerfeldbacteria bacterium]